MKEQCRLNLIAAKHPKALARHAMKTTRSGERAMTLRLVLLSLVAALGLTIPGGPLIEHWISSTQTWMNARFADWDTRNPQEGDYVIINDNHEMRFVSRRPTPACRTSQLTVAADLTLRADKVIRPAAPAERLPARPSVMLPISFRGTFKTFEPLSADGSNRPDFAMDLNRASEGIGVVPPVVVRPRLARPVFEPLIVDEILNTGVAYELNRQNEGLGIKPDEPRLVRSSPPRSETPPLPSFALLEASENLYFAGRLEPMSPAESVTVIAQVRPAPRSEECAVPESMDELDLPDDGLTIEHDGFAVAWIPFGRVAPSPAPAPVHQAAGRFEPLEVEDNVESRYADELNRRSEGFDVPAPGIASARRSDVGFNPPPARELNRAMKLTRDAVYAWVNVFTGPALVTASQ
jgi:hypothetical protein